MQGYYFKLQPLLNKEKIYEDECAGRLKAIHNEFTEKSSKIKKLLNSEIKYQEQLKAKKQQQISPTELKIYEVYFVRIVDEVNLSKIGLKEIEKKLIDTQNELSKAMKKRKALEKLKERGLEEYKDEIYSAFNKEMDEIAMVKFTRSKGPDSA